MTASSPLLGRTSWDRPPSESESKHLRPSVATEHEAGSLAPRTTDALALSSAPSTSSQKQSPSSLTPHRTHAFLPGPA
ncbi:hypothetical protein C1878_16380, partial [Gordonibacter sp. 28C]